MMLMSTKTRRRVVSTTAIFVLAGLIGGVLAGAATGL